MLHYLLKLHSSHLSHGMPPRVRLRTSYHEAGHGFFMSQDRLWKSVKIRLTGSGGLASADYSDAKSATNIQSIWKILQMLLAGIVVEQYFFSSYSKFGTMQDLENSLALIEKHKADLADYVQELGIEHDHELIKYVVPASKSEIDQIALTVLSAAVACCLQEVADNKNKIRCLGKALYKSARLNDKEIRKLLKHV